MKKTWLQKIAAITLVLALMAGVLSGCQSTEQATGGSADDDTTAAETAAPTETTDDDTATAETEKTTIYVATKATAKPYTYYDEDDNLVGYDIDLIRAVFERLPQYELVIEVTSAEALFAGLDTNKYQIAANDYGWTAERSEKYIYSLPIMTSTDLAVFNKNVDIDLDRTLTLDDLTELSWLGNAGNTFATNIEIYNEQNPDKAIEMNYTDADNTIQLSEIESGKYDFMTIGKPMFTYFQKQFNYDVLTADIEMGKEVRQGFAYFLIAAGNEQLAEEVNTVLKELAEEGITKELGEQYLGDDYTPYESYEED